DGRADLWAIGVVLHEALAGEPPFTAANHYTLLRRIVDDPPAPLPEDISPEIRAIVARCLAKEPRDRYASAAELRADLEASRRRSPSRGARSTVLSATPRSDAKTTRRRQTKSGGSVVTPVPARRRTRRALVAGAAIALLVWIASERRDHAEPALAAGGGSVVT